MGMHYYVKNNEMEIRVGKSSVGWQFLFYGYKDLGLNSKEDWFKFLKNNKDFIFTEDDIKISYEELSSLINFKSYSNKEFNKDRNIEEKGNYKDLFLKEKDSYNEFQYNTNIELVKRLILESNIFNNLSNDLNITKVEDMKNFDISYG